MSDNSVLPIEAITTSYYLRLTVNDVPGVLADITRILADSSISIGSMIQKQRADSTQADIIFLTHDAIERNVNGAIARIEALPTVMSEVTRLRLENLA